MIIQSVLPNNIIDSKHFTTISTIHNLFTRNTSYKKYDEIIFKIKQSIDVNIYHVLLCNPYSEIPSIYITDKINDVDILILRIY